MSNTPIIKERDGLISTSVFTRSADVNGRQATFYSVCIQRAYKKKGDTEYTRETINLDKDDVLKLANLLTKTYNKIVDEINLPKAKPVDDSWGEPVLNDGIPF